ncbi:MAG TPA: DUF2087 domain-containing protein [Bacilli bacterium]|nr:DUF2087 domain-containing protein [Bacilli bacterium]
MNIEEKLSSYLDDNKKLKVYPSKRKYKNMALLYLSNKFDYDEEYSEKEVNNIIDDNCVFKDAAWIRRELFGMGFLGRTMDGKKYWKEKEQPSLEYLGLLD